MTKEKKLKKIIEKAVDGGWEQNTYQTYYIDSLEWIFDHDFVKAFFGDDLIQKGYGNQNDVIYELYAWQHHIQQLALTLEKDRIDYLYGFIKDE